MVGALMTLTLGKASYFETKEKATLYVAGKLAQNYLNEGGVYYEGKTPADVDVHYCTDKQHAAKICQIVDNLLKEAELI